MRGKQRFDAADKLLIRITPADAGKTTFFGISTASLPDHPRGCGENTGDFAFISAEKGSPPRMRGKRHCMYMLTGFIGITPADAGKTKV